MEGGVEYDEGKAGVVAQKLDLGNAGIVVGGQDLFKMN